MYTIYPYHCCTKVKSLINYNKHIDILLLNSVYYTDYTTLNYNLVKKYYLMTMDKYSSYVMNSLGLYYNIDIIIMT